jgi:hypothetical protein
MMALDCLMNHLRPLFATVAGGQFTCRSSPLLASSGIHGRFLICGGSQTPKIARAHFSSVLSERGLCLSYESFTLSRGIQQYCGLYFVSMSAVFVLH